MKLQLTKLETVFSDTESDIRKKREEFDRHHCLLLPELLSPDLLNLILDKLKDDDFYLKDHGEIGSDLCLRENHIVFGLINFVLNRPEFFRIIQDLTGCKHIESFGGRIYRLMPNHNSYEWHTDLDEEQERVLAISLNLTPEAFQGGELQIRDTESLRIIYETHNIGFGDAIVFRIAPYHLAHRVLPIEGTVPKTAFAGWFKSHPESTSILKYMKQLGQVMRPPEKPEA